MISPAIAGAPVSFVDSSGKQWSIPLSAIQFTDQTTADPKNWPHFNDASLTEGDKQNLLDWLKYLTQQNLLRAGDPLPPPPAFTVAAIDAGTAGNGISINIANLAPNAAKPAQGKFDATVTAAQSWPGLTSATIGQVLGVKSPAKPGDQPGLVFLKGNAGAGAPLPIDQDVDASGELAVPANGGGIAFTLATRRAPDTKAAVHVTIKDVKPDGSFTLAAGWTRTVTAVQISGLGAAYAFAITVAPPAGGFANPPAPGTVKLVGGTDGAAATPAGATILSS